MTDFEQELIRAIEHGCPECGGRSVTVKYTQDVSSHVEVWDGLLEWEQETESNFVDRKVKCWECSETFWTAETGWIPELQEVIKNDDAV